MGRPAALLERLCARALSLGAESVLVEYKDHCEWIFAVNNGIATGIANYPSSGHEAKELRGVLYAAVKKPIPAVLGGRAVVLKVRVFESFGEDSFEVAIRPVPKADP